MTLILCVDDRGGLSFNGRRQSQDRRVREDLLTMAAGGALWMDDYSRRQFTEPEAAAIRVDRDPAARAAEGDGLCLLEQPGRRRGTGCACWSSRTRRRLWSGQTGWSCTAGDGTIQRTGGWICRRRAGGWRDRRSSPAAPTT